MSRLQEQADLRNLKLAEELEDELATHYWVVRSNHLMSVSRADLTVSERRAISSLLQATAAQTAKEAAALEREMSRKFGNG